MQQFPQILLTKNIFRFSYKSPSCQNHVSFCACHTRNWSRGGPGTILKRSLWSEQMNSTSLLAYKFWVKRHFFSHCAAMQVKINFGVYRWITWELTVVMWDNMLCFGNWGGLKSQKWRAVIGDLAGVPLLSHWISCNLELEIRINFLQNLWSRTESSVFENCSLYFPAFW